MLGDATPWIIAGGSVLSGLIGSSASKSAANAQVQAANAQIAEQRRQYDLTRADQAPFRDTGVAANARLRYLLGLGGDMSTATGGGTAGGGAAGGTAGGAATGVASAGGGVPSDAEVLARFMQEKDPALYATIQNENPAYWAEMAKGAVSSTPGAFEGLTRPTAADWAHYRDVLGRERTAAAAGASGAAGGAAGAPGTTSAYDPSDPYGLKADKFYASGLQFGLDQGIGALNARNIGSGLYDSGAALKGITRFANDYGSTKANDVYNRLAGVSGAGQVATNQIGAAGQNMANQVSAAEGAAGNARSAGIVGGANAWTGAINQGFQNYNNMQFNQTLQKLLNPGGTSGYGTNPYAPGYGGSSYNALYGRSYGVGGDPLYG